MDVGVLRSAFRAVVVAAAAGAGIATTLPAAGATSPAQVLSSALKAGLSESSLRWQSISVVKGFAVQFSTYAGHSSGTQALTVTQGTNLEGGAVIDLVGHNVYVTGSGIGLYLEGFTQAAALKEANKWIAVKPSSPEYNFLAVGLTVSTTLQPFQLKGRVTPVPGITVGGVKTLGFKGTSTAFDGVPAGPEKLYVRSKGKPLPVEAVQSPTTTLFFGWGTPVKVSAPHKPIALKPSWVRKK